MAAPITKIKMLPLCRALLLMMMLAVLPACSAETTTTTTQQVTINGERFNMELALDPETRRQGLSDRPAIAPDGGMLFVFPSPRVTYFVMRKCLVPIDIAFLDPGARIVTMYEMQTQPYDTPEKELRKYSSEWPVQFVMEFKAGTIKRLKLEPGQKIDLPTQQLKERAE